MRKLLQGDQSVQELRVDWQQNVGGRLLSQAGVGPDGSLAFVNDETLVVLRADGSRQMSVPQGRDDWFNIFRAPVIHSGGVVAAGQSGLTSLDSTGRKRWHQDIGEVATRPVVSSDGTVFAAAGESMHAFSPDGEKLWSTSLREKLVELWREERTAWANGLEQDLANPDKAHKKDVLEPLLDSARKELADPDFGKNLEIKLQGGPSLGPDGKLYCFTQVGPLFCLDQKTGEIEWVLPDKRNYLCEGGVAFSPEGDLLGVTGNSLLRVISPQGEVRFDYAAFLEKRLDQTSEQEASEARRAGNMGSCGLPALSPDGQTIYWAGRDGKLRAVDRQGNKRFTLEIPHRQGYAGEMDVSVGRDGTLYCANSQGLTALSPQGEQLWRYETNDKYAYATLVGDKVVLNTYSGEVFSLDCGTLNQKAAAALETSEPAPRIAVANGWVTIGGVRVKHRGQPAS
ncbi:MAG: hypothetical protein AMXMBFR33_37920 [Candidatus Xenobia bacterium]